MPEELHKPVKAYDLKAAFSDPAVRSRVARWEWLIEKVLALDKINEVYACVLRLMSEGRNFLQATLECMNTEYLVSRADLQKIPAQGGLIVVTNHPFGIMEGAVLGDILHRIRPDAKILGNYLTAGIPEAAPYFFPIDPFGRKSAVLGNMAMVKKVVRWVKNGGCAILYPAGEVAHLSLRRLSISESPWLPASAAIIRLAKAAVLPVFFEGRNSMLFHLLGLIHPWLRTAMLPREFLNKRNKVLSVHIGRTVPWKKLSAFDSDQEMMDYLRAKTLFLGNRARHKRFKLTQILFPKTKETIRQEIIAPVPATVLKQEISKLTQENLMFSSPEYSVFIATAGLIPNALMEIARLREVTFREVQEGTGKAFDMDSFDEYYRHLFLWNNKTSEIVGAYRVGLTDEILARYGPDGFYTATLFKYKSGFLEQLGNALELGRSFIRPEYQREFNCLSLLWRGIGQFIVRNPKYKTLFGPVSISEDYNVMSKNLMVLFLRRYKLDYERSRYVKPRAPFRGGRMRTMEKKFLPSMLSDIDEISLLISEIEKDGKGIPVLLRHYLKLNAVLLNFNVDRRFSNCIDGLMLVDVTNTDTRILRRFMGEEGFNTFARFHGLPLKQEPEEMLDLLEG